MVYLKAAWSSNTLSLIFKNSSLWSLALMLAWIDRTSSNSPRYLRRWANIRQTDWIFRAIFILWTSSLDLHPVTPATITSLALASLSRSLRTWRPLKRDWARIVEALSLWNLFFWAKPLQADWMEIEAAFCALNAREAKADRMKDWITIADLILWTSLRANHPRMPACISSVFYCWTISHSHSLYSIHSNTFFISL